MRPDDPKTASTPSLGMIPLRFFARTRSGDKGTGANIGVIVRRKPFYDRLREELTAERVADFFRPMGVTSVVRYELPNLTAFNFVLRGILSRGTKVDAQGKALGQAILEMPIPWPVWQLEDATPTETGEV